MKNIDSEEEMKRYDLAYSVLAETKMGSIETGIFSSQLRQFEKVITENISDGMSILELAAGDGEYSKYTLNSATKNIITDISINGLKLIKAFVDENNIKAKVEFINCDMQSLPFACEKFDVVVMAKSLSYGNKNSISEEVNRVLKDKGVFIVFDQIFNNPIYSFNRWIKYKNGSITKSSFTNRPKIKDLRLIARTFSDFRYTTHGVLFFLYPIIRSLMNAIMFSRFCDRFESRFPMFKSFGFTVVAVYYK